MDELIGEISTENHREVVGTKSELICKTCQYPQAVVCGNEQITLWDVSRA